MSDSSSCPLKRSRLSSEAAPVPPSDSEPLPTNNSPDPQEITYDLTLFDDDDDDEDDDLVPVPENESVAEVAENQNSENPHEEDNATQSSNSKKDIHLPLHEASTSATATVTDTKCQCKATEDAKAAVKTPGREELESLLECPVCTLTCCPPIYTCVAGHKICKHCKPKVKGCPLCRGRYNGTRDMVAEELFETLGLTEPEEQKVKPKPAPALPPPTSTSFGFGPLIPTGTTNASSTFTFSNTSSNYFSSSGNGSYSSPSSSQAPFVSISFSPMTNTFTSVAFGASPNGGNYDGFALSPTSPSPTRFMFSPLVPPSTAPGSIFSASSIQLASSRIGGSNSSASSGSSLNGSTNIHLTSPPTILQQSPLMSTYNISLPQKTAAETSSWEAFRGNSFNQYQPPLIQAPQANIFNTGVSTSDNSWSHPTASSSPITLNDPNYYCTPSPEELSVKSCVIGPSHYCFVDNFVVGHKKFGAVIFMGQMDVTGFDICKSVKFSQNTVHFDEPDRLFEHCNRYSRELQVTLYMTPGHDETYWRKACSLSGAEFLSYHHDTRVLTYKIGKGQLKWRGL